MFERPASGCVPKIAINHPGDVVRQVPRADWPGNHGLDLHIPKTGFNVPAVRTKWAIHQRPPKPPKAPARSLADALFAKVQQRVLAVLYGNPGRSFYANEIIGLARSGSGAREPARSGINPVTVTRRQAVALPANARSPVLELSPALATFALADVLGGWHRSRRDSRRVCYGSIEGPGHRSERHRPDGRADSLTYADSSPLWRKRRQDLDADAPDLLVRAGCRRRKQDNAFVMKGRNPNLAD